MTEAKEQSWWDLLKSKVNDMYDPSDYSNSVEKGKARRKAYQDDLEANPTLQKSRAVIQPKAKELSDSWDAYVDKNTQRVRSLTEGSGEWRIPMPLPHEESKSTPARPVKPQASSQEPVLFETSPVPEGYREELKKYFADKEAKEKKEPKPVLLPKSTTKKDTSKTKSGIKFGRSKELGLGLKDFEPLQSLTTPKDPAKQPERYLELRKKLEEFRGKDQRIDWKPLAAFMDGWQGTNLAASIKSPMSKEERETLAYEIEFKLEQMDERAEEAKANMDFRRAEFQADQEYRQGMMDLKNKELEGKGVLDPMDELRIKKMLLDIEYTKEQIKNTGARTHRTLNPPSKASSTKEADYSVQFEKLENDAMARQAFTDLFLEQQYYLLDDEAKTDTVERVDNFLHAKGMEALKLDYIRERKKDEISDDRTIYNRALENFKKNMEEKLKKDSKKQPFDINAHVDL